MNYASAVVFEVILPGTEDTPLPIEPLIRLKFKNGTDDAGFTTHPMLIKGRDGRPHEGDIPLSTFIGAFETALVRNKLDWCRVCEQLIARGCDQLRCMLPESQLQVGGHGTDNNLPLNLGLGKWIGGGRGLNLGAVAAVFIIIILLWFGRARKSRGTQRESEVRFVLL